MRLTQYKELDSKKRSEMRYFVYIYIDPRNNEVFYVGKGTRNRLEYTDRNEAVNYRLSDIAKSNTEPIIAPIRFNLDEDTAYEIEATLLDLLSFNPTFSLKNVSQGKYTNLRGIKAFTEFVRIKNGESNNIIIKLDDPNTIEELLKNERESYNCKLSNTKVKKIHYTDRIYIFKEIFNRLGYKKSDIIIFNKGKLKTHKYNDNLSIVIKDLIQLKLKNISIDYLLNGLSELYNQKIYLELKNEKDSNHEGRFFYKSKFKQNDIWLGKYYKDDNHVFLRMGQDKVDKITDIMNIVKKYI